MNDYKYSVMLDYELDLNILKKAEEKQAMHSYLLRVYQELVIPMSKAIRQIMLNFLLVSEAEIFSSDLHNKAYE